MLPATRLRAMDDGKAGQRVSDYVNVRHVVPVRHWDRRGNAEKVSFDVGTTPVVPLRADPRDLEAVGHPDNGVVRCAGVTWERLHRRIGAAGASEALGEPEAVAWLEGPGRSHVNTPLAMSLIRTPVCAWAGGADFGKSLDRSVPRSRRIESGEGWIGTALLAHVTDNLLFAGGGVYARKSGWAEGFHITGQRGQLRLNRYPSSDLALFRGGGGDNCFALSRGRPEECRILGEALGAFLGGPQDPYLVPGPDEGEPPVGDEDLVLMANLLVDRAYRTLSEAQASEAAGPVLAGLGSLRARALVGAIDATQADEAYRLVAWASDVLSDAGLESPKAQAMHAFATTVALPRLRNAMANAPEGEDALALSGFGL